MKLTASQTQRLARKIAFRILVADLQNKSLMEKVIRTRILEGAAGLQYGAWSRHPDQGLAEAAQHFPDLDPHWLKNDTTLFQILAKAVSQNMVGWGGDQQDDVIMEVLGDRKHLDSIGKRNARIIPEGKKGWEFAKSAVAVQGKHRAIDYGKRNKPEAGLPEGEKGEQLGEFLSPFSAPQDRRQQLLWVDAMEDLILADGRLFRSLEGLAKRLPDDALQTTIIQSWLDNPRQSNADIARSLEITSSNPSAYVGTVKNQMFQALFEKEKKYLEILRSKYGSLRLAASVRKISDQVLIARFEQHRAKILATKFMG